MDATVSLTSLETNELSVRRLLKAARRYPAPWLLSIERPDCAWEMRGVDLVLLVRYPDNSQERVLVRVHNSQERRDIKNQFPKEFVGQVLTVAVRLNEHDVELCERLYAEVQKARAAMQRFDADIVRISQPIVGKAIPYCQYLLALRKISPLYNGPINPFPLGKWLKLKLMPN